MKVLGWHGSLESEWERVGHGFSMHDGSAALIVDGKVVAAIEEERLNRVKHSNFFPARAIRFCLDQGGISLQDLDFIATGSSPEIMDRITALNFINEPDCKEWFHSIPDLSEVTSTKKLYNFLFKKNFDLDVVEKLRFCQHHIAHLSAAYYQSGFDSSLLVCFDGDGDKMSGMIGIGEGNDIKVLKGFSEDHSLGTFYRTCISILGYQIFDEYKVMGLAPFGDPRRFERLFSQLYHLKPDGDYEIMPVEEMMECLYQSEIRKMVRYKGEPFNRDHKDIAASLQESLEKIAFHVISHYQQKTGMRDLCFGGGVAHNSTLNGKLYYSDLFKRIFVQPAAHDAGNAVGAALYVNRQEKGLPVPNHRLKHLFLGYDIGDNQTVIQVLDRWKHLFHVEHHNNIEAKTAQLLAADAVIGWVQAKSEFGPRALGNRCILADPRPPRNKERINFMVKKREGYRPFAPSVKLEDLSEYFVLSETCNAEFSFMNFVIKVKKAHRENLGAITHIDGTARIQTVSQEQNQRYWNLLTEFNCLTGLPILLNTSFNNNAEPIVNTVEEAIICYLTTDITYLVVDNYLVTKNDSFHPEDLLSRFSVYLRPSQGLIKKSHITPDNEIGEVFGIENNYNDYFGRSQVEISEEMYHILRETKRHISLKNSIENKLLRGREREIADEVVQLLTARAVTMTPV